MKKRDKLLNKTRNFAASYLLSESIYVRENVIKNS